MKSKINLNLILQINHIIIDGLDQQQSLIVILVPNGRATPNTLELSKRFDIFPNPVRGSLTYIAASILLLMLWR